MNSNLQKDRLQRAIKSFLSEIHVEGVRTVYLVGSAASSEETFLDEATSKACMSDIDVMLDMSASSYLKFRLLAIDKKLRKTLAYRMNVLKREAHISVGVTSFSLSRLIPSVAPNSVFLSELTPLFNPVSKSSFSIVSAGVSKFDSFDLAISAIADYLMLKTEPDSVKTRNCCYIVTKRCLTLLNSLLLFNNWVSKSYSSRIALAQQHFGKLKAVLTAEDLSLLKMLTEYKLSGDTGLLFTAFNVPADDFPALFLCLESFFTKIASQILTCELAELVGDVCVSSNSSVNNLGTLIKKYICFNQKSFAAVCLHVVRLFPFALESDKTTFRMALFSLLSKKLTINVAIQCLVLLSFLGVASEGLTPQSLDRLAQTKLIWGCFKSQHDANAESCG